MEHMFVRVFENLIARVTGPMKFRLVVHDFSRGTYFRSLDSNREREV